MSEKAFSGKLIDVVVRDGKEIVVHGPAVAIVAVDVQEHVVLVRQERAPANGLVLELPAGGVEDGETPEQAARRELREETGYVPGALHYLGMHYPNPALQDNRMHVYLATDCLRIGEPTLDPFEDIEVELVGLPDLLRMIEQGLPMNSLMMASLTLALPAIKKFCSTPFAAL